jgi:hypothetical protein
VKNAARQKWNEVLGKAVIVAGGELVFEMTRCQ